MSHKGFPGSVDIERKILASISIYNHNLRTGEVAEGSEGQRLEDHRSGV